VPSLSGRSLDGTLSSVEARPRASDQVFESLATAVLHGRFAVGSALPSERELSAHFNVSRVILREAIHRLREFGLVRVRQGGQTVVLDAEQAPDLRVTALMIELGAAGEEMEREIAERQLLQWVNVLELAEARAVTSDIEPLKEAVDAYLAAGDDPAASFLERFWTEAARASKNRILLRETRWWFSLWQRRPSLGALLLHGDKATRAELYASLIERLRRREQAAGHFLASLREVLAI
jgi:DNA-binding FadR family transcriptional regulator